MKSSQPRQPTFVYWAKGMRLYIAALIILLSVIVWWWANASYGGTLLFATRLEEVYAWLSITFLGLALLIGPLYAAFSRLPGKQLAYDARRLLGVGAGWFAVLHVLVVYDSLFKWANPLHLPLDYQRSFVYGSAALLILLAMVATSFDAAQRGLGVWWYRLHRLIYLAALLALLHAFTIGTHATDALSLLCLSIVSFVILGLHIYAVYVRRRFSVWQIVTISCTALLLIILLLFGYQQYHNNQKLEQGATHARV